MHSSRRHFLQSGAVLLAAAAAPLRADPRFTSDPFKLGVASGDPWPDSVVLWTRLAPEPLQGGGMPSEKVPVRWRIAADERMNKVVRQGTAVASPEWAHSVHVEAQGLEPERWYWYQFDAGTGANRVFSPIGRTRTAPPLSSTPAKFAFAFVSCQKYETGYYTAYEHLCKDDLSLVLHLGDYIYEKGPSPAVRDMPLPTSITLEQYRARYAYYKMDPTLQKAHQLFPWAVVPDDHEVANNYAGMIPEKATEVAGFEQRRAGAYRAYYEHMPLRASAMPHAATIRLYRTLQIGQLANFHMLDTRQNRSDQPCGDGSKPSCPEREGPSTMMGSEQEAWLDRQLGHGTPRWNVLGQQVILSQVDLDPGPGQRFSMDKWDGYPAARKRLIERIVERKLQNVVVLSGDNHNNWAFDVKRNFDDEKSAVVASEFTGTSITSGGDGADVNPTYARVLTANPQVRFHNGRRGYVRCEVTPDRWRTDFRTVPYVTRPGAPVETAAQFIVEAGRPGLVRGN